MSVNCHRQLAARAISMCLSLLTLAVFIGGCSSDNIITESDAIKIAEREFVKRFGKKVLEQRPWII